MTGDASPARRILVVCTANQCRSPMGEGLIRAAADARGLGDRVVVSSAGTWAVGGYPATYHAVVVMESQGIDIGGHISRPINDDLVFASNLILVMTDSHRQAIMAEFPDSRAKTLLFSALAGGTWDIADPIGGPQEDYQATASELARLIEQGWAVIVGERLPGE